MSRKNAVAVARISAMPIVNTTWSASTTGNSSIGAANGTWYQTQHHRKKDARR